MFKELDLKLNVLFQEVTSEATTEATTEVTTPLTTEPTTGELIFFKFEKQTVVLLYPDSELSMTLYLE